ncbi:MAG TPA: GntR family transcriptional regulator [Pseudolabrys sp.]|nr:GntR family transcriptional regulator [Pseudolabrys sp.]
MLDTIQARIAAADASTGPKYQVLRDAILAAITTGEWTAGMRLPTEAELSKLLPYSLGTIQKAYGELVRDGLVVRSRGRGSFVAPMQRQMAEPWHCRFLGDDGTVLPIYPHLVGHRVVKPEKRWRELFGPRAKIVRIDRTISINREFDVTSRFFVPEAIARPLLARPRQNVESANFKAILLRELGMPISRIVQTVASIKATRGRPQLRLEATAYTVEGEVAYFQEIDIPDNPRRLLFDSDLRL